MTVTLARHNLKNSLFIFNDGIGKNFFDSAKFNSFEACITFSYKGEDRFCKAVGNQEELDAWEVKFQAAGAVLEHLDDLV